MSWALWQDDDHRSAKLHLHYSVIRQTVINASVTDANCPRSNSVLLSDLTMFSCFIILAESSYQASL